MKIQKIALHSLRSLGTLGEMAASLIENQRHQIVELTQALETSERQVRDQAREIDRINKLLLEAKRKPKRGVKR